MHYILITDKQEHIKLSAQCLEKNSLMWIVYCLSFLSFLKCVLCMSLMLHSLCLTCASASLTASSGSLQTSQFKLHQELLTSLVLFVSSYFDTCNVFICWLRVWLRKGFVNHTSIIWFICMSSSVSSSHQSLLSPCEVREFDCAVDEVSSWQPILLFSICLKCRRCFKSNKESSHFKRWKFSHQTRESALVQS